MQCSLNFSKLRGKYPFCRLFKNVLKKDSKNWILSLHYCLSLQLQQITQTSVLIIHDIMPNLIPQLPIIISFIVKYIKLWTACFMLVTYYIFLIKLKPNLGCQKILSNLAVIHFRSMTPPQRTRTLAVTGIWNSWCILQIVKCGCRLRLIIITFISCASSVNQC